MYRISFCLLAILIAGLGAVAADSTLVVRSYELQHASVSEVVELVQDILSDDGSVTARPRASLVQVQDRRDFIEVISRLVENIDQPPERFRISVELIDASETAFPDGAEFDPGDKVRRMFRYEHFRLEGSAAIEGAMGEDYVVRLGSEHQLQLGTSHVVSPGGYFRHNVPPPRRRPEGQAEKTSEGYEQDLPSPARIVEGRLQIDPLRLTRIREKSPSLTQEVEVLKTKVNLTGGQRAILGASSSESSRRATVLVVRFESMGDE